jgi:UDP-2,3-diacylglucosamine hydrolase
MTTPRKTLFISDLHLEQNQPQITRQFLQLLKECDSSVDALYILGDLFEVWIGDDDDAPFHREIIEALHAVTQRGLPIFFLYGNRDFLIGKQFLQKTGCHLLKDEEKISVYKTPVLIMHGDTLCTQDLAYLRARKKARHIVWQTLFLLLPLWLRRKIANKMRAKSMQHMRKTPLEIMDVTEEEVKRVMQEHKVDFLVHGHTHRPGFHTFSLDEKAVTRIVLGAWHEHGNMLVWDETGKREWLEF